MALGGIILLAFSFIPLPVIPDAEEPLPFFSKITGIFFEPSRVFRNLRVHPHWVGAFAVVVVLSVIYTFAFVQRITPERIVDHTTQKVAEMGPPLAPPPDRIEAMREAQLKQLKNPIERAGTVIKSAVGVFVMGALTAALCLLGVLAFGGRINFWQALSVVFYYWIPVTAIQKILGLAILYLKTPEDLHPILNQETTLQDNLGILMSPAAHPVLFVLLSFIGLTWFYLLWLRAKGLQLAGTRVSSSASMGCFDHAVRSADDCRDHLGFVVFRIYFLATKSHTKRHIKHKKKEGTVDSISSTLLLLFVLYVPFCGSLVSE